MLNRTTQFENTFVMWDPDVFDTSMTWKEVVDCKKEKGTSPEGCVVLTMEEYQAVMELVDEVKWQAFAEGIKEGQGD